MNKEHYPPEKEYKGKRFNKWTVLEYAYSVRSTHVYHTHYYRCRCECGIIRIVNLKNMQGGQSKCCGCFKPGLKRPRKKRKKRILENNARRLERGR